MQIFVLIYLFPFCSSSFLLNETSYQYPAFYHYFGTKSPYFSTVSPSFPSPLSQQCKVIQLNYVIRHGTRNPSSKDIRKFQFLLEKFQSQTNLIPWYMNYTLPYNEQYGNELVETGVIEETTLGYRLRERYGNDMDLRYSNHKYEFTATYKRRTLQSAQAFAYGFFGNTQPIHYIRGDRNDHILRGFDTCDRSTVEVNRNVTACYLSEKYKNSEDFQSKYYKFLQRIRHLAGNPQMELSIHDYLGALKLCSYDGAIYNITTQWCSLFTEDMLASYDYYIDLCQYARKGSLRTDTVLSLPCVTAIPLLTDIYTSLRDRVLNKSTKSGLFRFAHMETLMPLMCILNLYHENPLASLDKYTMREFKTSRLCPFAGNLGFVLYECNESQYRIEVLHNEAVVSLPMCGETCTFDEFERMYKSILQYNDFITSCHWKGHPLDIPLPL